MFYPSTSSTLSFLGASFIEKVTEGEKNKTKSKGRVSSCRIAGSKLVFIDIVQDTHSIQGVCQFGKLDNSSQPDLALEDFRALFRLLRRGDVISE
jgi:lysyl-tRNA synthetase class 2